MNHYDLQSNDAAYTDTKSFVGLFFFHLVAFFPCPSRLFSSHERQRVPRRYKQSVPKQIKEKEEHRRAPVRKKNALSFAGAGSDEEEDDEEAEGNVKVKSAHGVLNNPRLSRDVAYPEEAIGSVLHLVAEKKKLREGG
eukprot:s7146_g1.t1